MSWRHIMGHPVKLALLLLGTLVVVSGVSTVSTPTARTQGLPAAVIDPVLQLPWPTGQRWYFTNGPHKAWGTGTPWGALDFQPPASIGCSPPEAANWWVRPVAPGKVTFAANYRVEIDHENGWQTLYDHVSSITVSVDQRVDTSTDLGHPSCYAGATGRSIHLAIKKDGAWIDFRSVPLTLSGWEVRSDGQEGSGTLYRNGVSVAIYGLVINDGVTPPLTPVPTPTATPTTLTRTPSPTPTVTPTPTYGPTATLTPTPTRTATPTPTSTLTPTPTSTPRPVQILPGWNIISVPGPQVDPSIQAVFAQHLAITRVFGYRDEQWESANRTPDGWRGSLTDIVDGRGYFVYATAPTTITLHPRRADPLSPPPAYSLPAGWSLLGYTSSIASMPADSYLGTVQGKWLQAYRYDLLRGWGVTKPGGLGFTTLESGRGYWIFLASEGTLVPPP